MKQAVICRLCGQTELSSFLKLQRSPRQISRLLGEAELATDSTLVLDVVQCRNCAFIQLSAMVTAPEYDDYELSWMHISTLRDYRAGLARDFVDRFRLGGRRVLDIGCGSGEFLMCLQDAGAVPVGIEPSEKLVARARRAGFTVLKDVVHEKAFADQEPFDGWICLQVLEHLSNPVRFLTDLRGAMTSDGIALVEVPRVELIIAQNRFYDFFGDHLNYFSESTLRLTCELAGYEVLETRTGLQDQFLIAIIRPARELFNSSLSSSRDSSLAMLRTWYDEKLATGQSVAFWGAGYKSLATISEANLNGVRYVVDSDPAKHGRFTPGSHLPIVAPSKLASDPVQAIVLAAVAYKAEILKQIRDDLGYRGEVIALDKGLEIL